MNERIQELADQARIHSKEGFYTYTQIDEQKFAELMMEDVLNIVGNGGEFASRPKLIEKIKEHFGVEE